MLPRSFPTTIIALLLALATFSPPSVQAAHHQGHRDGVLVGELVYNAMIDPSNSQEARWVLAADVRDISAAGAKIWNSNYAGKSHPSGVKFNEKGFPDFSPFAKAEVQIKKLTGNVTKDSASANKAVGLPETPAGYTWHHVEDGTTMQFVPRSVDEAARHAGGAAVIRNAAKKLD